MALVWQCPGCQKKIGIPDDAMDRQVRCPICQRVFRPRDTQAISPAPVAPPPSAPPAPVAQPAITASPAEPELVPVEAVEPPRPREPQPPREPELPRLPSRPREPRDRIERVETAPLEARPHRVAVYSYTLRQTLPSDLPGAGLGLATLIVLAVCLVLNVLLVMQFASRFEILDALSRGQARQAQTLEDGYRIRGIILIIFWLVLHIACVVLFCVWIWRAYANLYLFGVDDLRFSPGWGVASWFLPFANLALPFLVLQELWRASSPRAALHDRTDWKRQSFSVLAILLWIVTVLDFVIQVILVFHGSASAQPYDRRVQHLQLETWFYMAAVAGLALSAFLMILYILGLGIRQRRRLRKVLAGAEGGAP